MKFTNILAIAASFTSLVSAVAIDATSESEIEVAPSTNISSIAARAPGQPKYRGFKDSCPDRWLEGTWLVANCKRYDGNTQRTRIDLNTITANVCGNLVWMWNGHYGESCTSSSSLECRFDSYTTDMTCQCWHCQHEKGTQTTRPYNMNDVIGNVNGVLLTF